jgi:hypothetical protein
LLESFKKLEGSELVAYCNERSIYYDCASRTTQNELVRQLSRAYDSVVESFAYCKNIGDVKKQLEDQLHPILDTMSLNATFGRGIVARDILHFISQGEGLLPHDLYDALAYIETHKLRDVIWNERTQDETRAQAKARSAAIRREREEQENQELAKKEKASQELYRKIRGVKPMANPEIADQLYEAEMERLRLMKEGKVKLQ